MNLSEITNKTQINQIIKTYALRHRQGQPFTVDELAMHLPGYNLTKLKWNLEDAVISGLLGKRGEHRYFGIDNRTLKEKILSLYGGADSISYSIAEIERFFKIRPQEVTDAIAELVAEGKLERHWFMGGNLWLKLEAESDK